MDYPRKWMKEFLLLYRRLPCLWDADHPHYKTRTQRHAAYARLRLKLREVNPSASIDMVKKKLQNCRSAYRREVRRTIRSAQAAGGDEEAVRVPHLWYFALLSFLHEKELRQVAEVAARAARDAEPSGGGGGGGGGELQHDEDTYKYETLELEEDYSPQRSPIVVEEEEEAQLKNSQPPSPASSLSLEASTSRAERRTRAPREERGVAGRERDRFDAAGENIAFKLRALDERQRILAEKLIYDVLFEAELETLTRHCRLLASSAAASSAPD